MIKKINLISIIFISKIVVRSLPFIFDGHKDEESRESKVNGSILPIRLSLLSFEFYNRIKLFPWWLQYHKGHTVESILQRNIIDIGGSLGIDLKWIKNILRHTISEFSKKGLGTNYYGYHNLQHELESVYFTMISIAGINEGKDFRITDKETKYLFVAALFHDYDPSKEFDKPNEDSVEYFIRNDPKIIEFIKDAQLNIDIVMALIHRTAYPFEGKIANYANKKINDLLSQTGIPKSDFDSRERYKELGWFLSVSERIAGYALGNFEHAKDMAKRNAHALGWHPSVINKNSVKYFDYLMVEEKKMFDLILLHIPLEFRKNFYDNVAYFKDSWNKELGLKNSKKGTRLLFVVEQRDMKLKKETAETLLNINRQVSAIIQLNDDYFKDTLLDNHSILVTLRMNSNVGDIIGYAKGGPIENYELRPGTTDKNIGMMNTIYLEGVVILEGYWGDSAGHFLRIKFLKEAIEQGFKYVTGFVHRDVIMQRKKKSELIEIVQKFDPDKLDYYRIDLNNPIYQNLVADAYDIVC